MKILKVVSFFLIILLFGSCSEMSERKRLTKQYVKVHELLGKASWYGKRYHGKLTASGETFNMRKYTAAHKTLPFGVVVRVTNIKNGKSVDVTINDRGPYVKGEIISLSKKAYGKIADKDKNVVDVQVEILDISGIYTVD
jgi:rare lipoprotein A